MEKCGTSQCLMEENLHLSHPIPPTPRHNGAVRDALRQRQRVAALPALPRRLRRLGRLVREVRGRLGLARKRGFGVAKSWEKPRKMVDFMGTSLENPTENMEFMGKSLENLWKQRNNWHFMAKSWENHHGIWKMMGIMTKNGTIVGCNNIDPGKPAAEVSQT